jgi:hypothetical protein
VASTTELGPPQPTRTMSFPPMSSDERMSIGGEWFEVVSGAHRHVWSVRERCRSSDRCSRHDGDLFQVFAVFVLNEAYLAERSSATESYRSISTGASPCRSAPVADRSQSLPAARLTMRAIEQSLANDAISVIMGVYRNDPRCIRQGPLQLDRLIWTDGSRRNRAMVR